MSRRGLTIAREHGAALPASKALADAERLLVERKNRRLELLRAANSWRFVADATPESLKALAGP